MKKLMSIVALALMAQGCTAVVSSPEETVATYNLYQDQLEALLIQECVNLHGANGCTPYPNDLECKQLRIEIKADGRTWVDCQADGKVIKRGYADFSDGVPIMCKTNKDMSCQKCMDVFGNNILDTCNRGTQSFRSPSMGAGFGEGGYLVEPGDNPDGKPNPGNPPNTPPHNPPDNGGNNGSNDAPPMTPPSAGDTCNPANAVLLYAKELNKILAHENLNFSWTPDLNKFVDPKGGFFGNGQTASNITCHAFTAKIKSKIHKCAVKKNGECFYCYAGWLTGFKKTCRCYRVALAALKAACGQVTAGCDINQWSGAMIQAYGIATKWLFSPSYSNFYGQVQTPNGGAKFPKCKGSPLVLDLAGDGVKPTAPADGVMFDMLGLGQLKTSWITGDDALLALDRDGNGRIDSGNELFGEATAGIPHEDGFDALASLDNNSDGKVDTKDPVYKKLVVWQDRNGDGVSQKSELRSLNKAGVKSLGLSVTINSGKVDKHGNDMHLQGGFTRTDGSSGLMVDVFFVAK